MSFKCLRTYWQEKRGWHTSVAGSTCCVCGLRDTGFHRDKGNLDLCETHSHMTLRTITLIVQCRTTDTKITEEVFEAGRYNSWDFDALIPYLEDRLLVKRAIFTLANCSRPHVPATTYDESIQLLAEELAKRLLLTQKPSTAVATGDLQQPAGS